MTATARRTWALVIVSLATFMTYLDNNIVNVAIPAIQRHLGLSTSGTEWVVSGYILTFAGLLLAGGRLGDIYGRRRLFLVGLGLFTIASLGAGLAGSDTTLIAARAAQGVGAALVTPTTLAIISAVFTTARERAVAVGIWSAVGALALAVGPLLGGLISQHLDWSWVFFINVPVGVITLVLARWLLPDDAGLGAHKRLDLAGLTSSALMLFALTFALIEGSDDGWTSAVIVTSFAVAVAALATFVVVERHRADPMVDVSLFASRVFSGGVGAIVMWGFGLFGIYFFTSLYLQDVLGMSPTVAGSAFVPMALVMAGTATVAERVANRIGAHRAVALAMGLMALGIASVSLLGRDAAFVDLMPSFVVIGIGGGLSVPLTSMILNAMPTEQAGVAGGIFNAAREVSGLLGITVIGVILTARRTAELHAGTGPLTAFLSGYRFGLVTAGVLVAAGGLAAYLALRGSSQRPAEAEAGSVPELELVG